MGLCASAGTLFAGLFVLPTLARDEMRDEVETLMRGIGHSLSGYASHMFVPDQPPAKPIPADTTASRRKLMMARMQEEITSDEQYRLVHAHVECVCVVECMSVCVYAPPPHPPRTTVGLGEGGVVGDHAATIESSSMIGSSQCDQ